MKIKNYLKFEDNEIFLMDSNNEVVDSKKYKTPKDARNAFDAILLGLANDKSIKFETKFYIPEYPPQLVEVLVKDDKDNLKITL